MLRRVLVVLAAVAFAAHGSPRNSSGAPSPDPTTLRAWVEEGRKVFLTGSLPPHAWEQVIPRENLNRPVDGEPEKLASRRQLLEMIFPGMDFPDSSLSRRVRAEELIQATCREFADKGKVSQLDRSLAFLLPDSLLPPETERSRLLGLRTLLDNPFCRARFAEGRSVSPERIECESEGLAAAGMNGGHWPARCLEISASKGACLVWGHGGCMLAEDEFNALAVSGSTSLAAGTAWQARNAVLQEALRVKFRGGSLSVELSGGNVLLANLDIPGFREWLKGREGSDTLTRVRYLVSSDSVWLAKLRERTECGCPADSVACPAVWREIPTGEMPPATLSGGASCRVLGPFMTAREFRLILETGRTRIRAAPAVRRGNWETLTTSLERLMEEGEPHPADSAAYVPFAREKGFRNPDTLEFDLLIRPGKGDFMAGSGIWASSGTLRPMRIQSVSADRYPDSIAWALALRGAWDSLSGPFETTGDQIWIKPVRRLSGSGSVPFHEAHVRVRRAMSRSLILAGLIGILESPTLPSGRATTQSMEPSPKDESDGASSALLAGGSEAAPGERVHLPPDWDKMPENARLAWRRWQSGGRRFQEWKKGLTLDASAESMGFKL